MIINDVSNFKGLLSKTYASLKICIYSLAKWNTKKSSVEWYHNDLDKTVTIAVQE